MTNLEVALQLTLALIEKGGIDFDEYADDEYNLKENRNAFNAKQVSNAFKTILNGIKD